MHLRVAIFNGSHAYDFWKRSSGKSKCFERPECELLNVISTALKQKLIPVFPTDGGLGGVPMQNGNWDGIVGLLQRKEADFANDLAVSYERSQVIDFALPLQYDKAIFAIRSAKPMDTNYTLFRPFQLSAWISILLSFLVCLFVLSILRHRKQTSKSSVTFTASLISSAEILTGMRDFKSTLRNPAAQLFWAFSRVPMVILVSCYTAVLLSVLMNPMKEPQIETFAELAEATKIGKVKIAIQESSFVNIMLSSAKSGILKDLANNIQHRHVYEQNYTGLMKLLEDGYAIVDYLYDTTVMFDDGLMSKEDLFISDDSIMGMAYGGTAMRKGFGNKKRLNQITSRLLETGIYKRIRSNHVHITQQKNQQQRKQLIKKGHFKLSTLKPLSLKELKGFFLIITIGFALSGLVLLYERHVGRKNIKKVFKKRNRNSRR